MKISKRLVRAGEYINLHWGFFLFLLCGMQLFGLITVLLLNGVGVAGDAPDYITAALSFLNNGIMLDSSGNPILFRTPGYPLMLALIYSCTGRSNLAVVIIQILMVLTITWMIFSIVSDCTHRAIGLLAGLFYALDFSVYLNCTCILTDIPFSFFVALSAYTLFQYLKKNKFPYLILCFASLNYAMLVRPNIMYLNMLLFIGLLLLSIFKKLSWKKSIIFILMFLTAFGGWSIRNMVYFGRPVFTTIRDDSTFIWYAPLLYADEENCSSEEAGKFFSEAMDNKYPDFSSLDRLARAEARRDIGTSYIKEHIPGYIKMNLKGLLNEMFGPSAEFINSLPIADVLKKLIILAVIGLLFLCYMIYAVGFIINIRKLTWMDWIFLLTTLYFMASTAVLGYSRYRIAYYPICLMGAFICWRNKFRSVG